MSCCALINSFLALSRVRQLLISIYLFIVCIQGFSLVPLCIYFADYPFSLHSKHRGLCPNNSLIKEPQGFGIDRIMYYLCTYKLIVYSNYYRRKGRSSYSCLFLCLDGLLLHSHGVSRRFARQQKVPEQPCYGHKTVYHDPKDGLRFKIAGYLFEKVGYVFQKVGYVLPKSC